MKKEPAHRKQKKAELSGSEFKESLAKAFQDVVRKAARQNLELSFSIDGQIVIVEAKKLQSILTRHKNGSSIKELIHTAQLA